MNKCAKTFTYLSTYMIVCVCPQYTHTHRNRYTLISRDWYEYEFIYDVLIYIIYF